MMSSRPPGGDVRRGGAACPTGRRHLLEEHGESLHEGFVIRSVVAGMIISTTGTSASPLCRPLPRCFLQLVTFPDITLASGDIECALQVGPGLG